MNTIALYGRSFYVTATLTLILLCSSFRANAQCDPVMGDQTSYGDNEWIGYVYSNIVQGGPGIAPPNPFIGTYSGYITPGETFSVHLLENQPLAGPDLCGDHYQNYSIKFKMHIDVAPGYYTFRVGGDDGYRLSLDGGATFPENMQAWFEHGVIESEGTYYINGSADLVIDYYEGPGESHIIFDYYPAECMATAPTSVSNAQIAACVGNTTLTAQGGTAGTAFYQWGSGNVVGENVLPGNDVSVTVYNTGTYWVRRGMYGPCRSNPDVAEYTDAYVFNVTATNNAPGDQVTYGIGQWMVYAYQGNNSNMLSNAYKGYYTFDPLTFNSENSFDQAGENPSNAPTWIGCSWPGDNDFWFDARRTGFECGEYVFAARKWDDEIWVYVDIDGSGPAAEQQVYHYNGWSAGVQNIPLGTFYLNESSTVRIILREAGGDANAWIDITKTSSAPVSLSGNNALCYGQSTTLTASGGSTGTGGTYQWGTGAVSDANVIAGQTAGTLTVSPTADTTYWVRITFPGYCSTTVTQATTLVVTVDNTVAGTLATSNATICKNTGINNIVLTGYSGAIQKWQSADDEAFTVNVQDHNITFSTLTAANTGALISSKYFRALVQDGICSNIATEPLLITVTPAVVYNGAWSGSYDITTAVEIMADLDLTEDMAVCSCLVANDAVVTVPEGINLTVKGKLTVAEGSEFILENKGSLIQIDDIQDNGSISATRSSSKIMRLDYSIWSAPVTGQQLLDFSPETLPNRFYVYNTVTDIYNVIAPTQDFMPATGYLIRTPNTHPSSVPTVHTGTFTGQPNNGTVVRTLNYIDPATEEVGEGEEPRLASFNAIGNPYPSPISVNDFIDANEGIISGQLWFWRKTNNTEESSYCTLTKFAYIANSAPGGTNDFAVNPNGVINTGQGFFVNALTPGSVIFTNSLRMGNSSDQFLRTAQDDSSRMWINLKGSGSAFSQTVIGYTNEATLGYDNGIDGRSLAGGGVSLYSIIDGHELAIQGRPQFFTEDIVPLGFTANEAGNFTFSLDHADGIFENEQDMYLLDGFTGLTHNLRNGDYSFATEAGTFDGRFAIVYAEALGNGDIDAGNRNVIAFAQDAKVNVNAPKPIEELQLYDLHGRLLYQHGNIASERFSTPSLNLSKGIVVIKIKLDDNTTATKKIVFE